MWYKKCKKVRIFFIWYFWKKWKEIEGEWQWFAKLAFKIVWQIILIGHEDKNYFCNFKIVVCLNYLLIFF
jgi:hypothetical protein